MSYDGRIQADARHLPIADGCVQMCVTSPPYFGLRDYGHDGQIGLEKTPQDYIQALVDVFREVRRVLRPDGVLWVNIGDSYNAYNGGAGPSSSLSRGAQTTQRPQLETGYGLRVSSLKPKDLIGIPWMLAFALRDDGWYLRSDVIWSKPNPMPESVQDRCTKAHEYLFLLAKSERYFYDHDAIKEQADVSNWRDCPTSRRQTTGPTDSGMQNGRYYTDRNKRSVWTIATSPYPESHYAVFPPALIEPCILAGSKPGDLVLDPFFGSGTVGRVCEQYSRRWVGVDLGYQHLQEKRLQNIQKVLV